jgi:hypothetical protein
MGICQCQEERKVKITHKRKNYPKQEPKTMHEADLRKHLDEIFDKYDRDCNGELS